MREDIAPGAVFPDYELLDQAGVARKLSELQGGNPMVLHLSRGSYDPKEHRFLRNLVLQKVRPDLIWGHLGFVRPGIEATGTCFSSIRSMNRSGTPRA